MSSDSRARSIDRVAVPRRLLEAYLTEAGLAAARKQELGRKIREARQAKRWKQKHLAAAVHVEPVTVSRWERGQHEPDLDMLEQIAEATGQTLAFFVDASPVADDNAVLRRLDDLQEQVEELARLVRDEIRRGSSAAQR